MKKILAYGFENKLEKLRKLEKLAGQYQIQVEAIKKKDLSKKVGFLMGLIKEDNSSIFEDQPFEIEFLVFSDFNRELLRDFISVSNKLGLAVSHKAIITKANQEWTLKHLIDHIQDEHKMVKRYKELGVLIMKAQEVFKEEPSKELKEAIDFGLSIKKIEDISEKDIKARYNIIDELIN